MENYKSTRRRKWSFRRKVKKERKKEKSLGIERTNISFSFSEQLDKSLLSLFGSTKEATDGATLLDKLEVFLLEGDREGACQFAMENDMWAHALMISQSVNTGDLYKRTASQFINRTLFSSSVQLTSQVTDDKKSLRILYSLFGGAGADTGKTSLMIFISLTIALK